MLTRAVLEQCCLVGLCGLSGKRPTHRQESVLCPYRLAHYGHWLGIHRTRRSNRMVPPISHQKRILARQVRGLDGRCTKHSHVKSRTMSGVKRAGRLGNLRNCSLHTLFQGLAVQARGELAKRKERGSHSIQRVQHRIQVQRQNCIRPPLPS